MLVIRSLTKLSGTFMFSYKCVFAYRLSFRITAIPFRGFDCAVNHGDDVFVSVYDEWRVYV